MPKEKKFSGAEKLQQRIMEWYQIHPKDSYNYLQISQELGIFGRANRADVYDMLTQLAADGVLKEVSTGRYVLADRPTHAELIGVMERRHNGMHLVRVTPATKEGEEPAETEVYTVFDGDDMQALSGDTVRIQKVRAPQKKGRRDKTPGLQARVVEVVKRVEHRYVGVLQKNKQYAFVLPDNRALDKDIFIPEERRGKAKNGDKVVVDIEQWPAFSKNPIGKVVDVLGRQGDNDVEMNAILVEYGLPYKYPDNVVRAADKIKEDITPEEIARREDCRPITTFTIDPADAKDFDDALSLRKLDNGRWEAGVHIADVSHYVLPGTVIDEEAYRRATSIYLVDRTIPMLPERLCNALCSLRPDEDKLCYSVLFEMDDDANILKHRIVKTVIRSDRRFTYEEAQEIIETGRGDYAAEVLQLDRLAKQLRARRFAEGAIAFEREEIKFVIDETGKPVDVYFKVSKDANKLIEEFMLLANRTVAETIGKVEGNSRAKGAKNRGKKAKTFVYRIHDKPSPEKLEGLIAMASRFGHKMPPTSNGRLISQGINKLMAEVHDRPEENLLSMLAIRTQAKAIYSTENIGHYGLAFDYYAHFTSPIRRYPDTMVHRLLDRYLNHNGRSVPKMQYDEYCEHCSKMEQLAASAERASDKYKQAEFLRDRMGVVFDGTVSGVSEWGIYVEIDENHCEGMVPVRDMKDDHYVFDEKNYCLIGRRTHRRFTLGDKVKVQVAAVNMERKTVDFTFA